MSKITTFFKLVGKGNFRGIIRAIRKRTRKFTYLLRARIEDFRLGGVSLESLIPSKFADSGAHPTQSTDYRLLDSMFEAYSLKKSSVLIDIGSGEGRVLSYLYLRGHKGKLIGIELDQDATNTAKKRTAKCKNIELHCANVLDCASIISEANCLFMSNPFGEEVLRMFVDMVEKTCNHDLIVYYAYDHLSKIVLDKRDNWTVMRRGIVRRPEKHSVYYSIYKFTAPNK